MTAFFPTKTILKMKEIGVSEREIHNVIQYGEERKLSSGADSIIKKFDGYEIGLFYVKNPDTREYIITHVWKRPRR